LLLEAYPDRKRDDVRSQPHEHAQPAAHSPKVALCVQLAQKCDTLNAPIIVALQTPELVDICRWESGS